MLTLLLLASFLFLCLCAESPFGPSTANKLGHAARRRNFHCSRFEHRYRGEYQWQRRWLHDLSRCFTEATYWRASGGIIGFRGGTNSKAYGINDTAGFIVGQTSGRAVVWTL